MVHFLGVPAFQLNSLNSLCPQLTPYKSVVWTLYAATAIPFFCAWCFYLLYRFYEFHYGEYVRFLPFSPRFPG
jgi:hypothetical protein